MRKMQALFRAYLANDLSTITTTSSSASSSPRSNVNENENDKHSSHQNKRENESLLQSKSQCWVTAPQLAKLIDMRTDRLLRLVRALSGIGVFEESSVVSNANGMYGGMESSNTNSRGINKGGDSSANAMLTLIRNTNESDLLRFDHPNSMRGAVMMFGGPQMQGMTRLHEALITGVPSFETEFKRDFWTFHNQPENQNHFEEFNEGMTNLAQVAKQSVSQDYAGFEYAKAVVDIAGRGK
jgi:hypothetical protein